jgi:hypothetical protein
MLEISCVRFSSLVTRNYSRLVNLRYNRHGEAIYFLVVGCWFLFLVWGLMGLQRRGGDSFGDGVADE